MSNRIEINLKRVLCAAVAGFLYITAQAREVDNFDFDWKFSLSDDASAKDPAFDDDAWRSLDLPHDWSIEGPYDQANPGGIHMGFLPGGIGWYRKAFEWSERWTGKAVFLEFDGVYMNSDVWINGRHLGHRPNGYISFGYEITEYLKEGTNVVAVRADNGKTPSGRWYTGSGIYRHTRLVATDPVRVEQWGHFITTPKIERNAATVHVRTTLRNGRGSDAGLQVETVVYSPSGEPVGSVRSQARAGGGGSLTLSQELSVADPRLWSPDTPDLYVARTRIFDGDRILDTYETRFGIREILFTADEGFFLNGKATLLKGICMHHDAGPLGAAVPDDVLRGRLRLLREMGCNAVRTSHNPFAPEFYDLCDELGILVMDEAFDGWDKPKADHDYGHYFGEWWQRDLEDFIKRDRNHPSVIIWSIGNEVHGYTFDRQKDIATYFKQFDTTRPITQGRGYEGPYIDVAGFNGHGEERGKFEWYREAFPNRPIIGTEITHTLQTRGVYRTKTWYRMRDNPAPWEIGKQFSSIEHKVYKIPDFTETEVFEGESSRYDSSYDNSIVRIGVRDDWNRVLENGYYSGNFRWTGFDYLGESFGWPARTANFGIIDLAGIPKDHYYLYQSLWSDKPMAHILPHWTHPGKEGVAIPVVVYSNAETVELFLNGQSLGTKTIDPKVETIWNVPYAAGSLKAIARRSGWTVAEASVRTAGIESRVHVAADRISVAANRTDVIRVDVEIRDGEGNCVPLADDRIEFSITGPGRLIGVENGDILDLDPNKASSRKVFRGKCVAYIQATDTIGTIRLAASSSGLESAMIEIDSGTK